jgi:hypothetical protein
MKYFLLLTLTFLINCAAFNAVSTSSQSLDSVSTSLNSVSRALDSVSSISGSLTSISTSSKDKDKKDSQYRKDVQDLTALSVIQGSSKSLEMDLQNLAMQNGYLSWKENPNSYLGIGAGLKKAGVQPSQFESFASKYKQTNPHLHTLLYQGYSQI